ncbi:MAG: DUF3822 family protein [bacterium]|nr:DUF3822 family protein [bacterium]
MSSEAFLTKQFYSQLPANQEVLSLSMIIGPNSFMYAISTNEFSNIVELCHVEITHMAHDVYDSTQTISHLINNYRLSQKKFSKVLVTFLNHHFTLAPGAFSESSEVKKLLSFSTGNPLINRALQHTLNNIQFLYTIDQDLLSLIEKTFPNAAIRHSGAINISLFMSQHSLINSDLYLTISNGLIELTAKRNQELLFYNVYNYSTNEDILYYVLFAMEQFTLDPLQCNMVISGEREVSDEVITHLKKYVKHLSFAVQHPSVKLSGELAGLPQHFYFTLLNQHVCEL